MSTVVLRPNSTDTINAVNTSGALAAHSVLSDTNNATVAQGAADHAYLMLGFSSAGVTVSSSVRVKGVQIGLCYANSGNLPLRGEKLVYRFRDGLTGALSQTVITSSVTTTFPTASAPLYGPQAITAPDGTAWTQAKIDALQVQLLWYGTTPSGGFLRVSEVYAQFTLNNQPVVSGITVTNTATTTRPTVNFQFVDPEDGQTAWHAKVFTAAQYGAAGFDPETATATWDSDTNLNDLTIFMIGQDLLLGVTYKVYVKAAQAWPGPEGQFWYSAWAASSSFTISITVPPTPTVTISQQLGSPHYRNLITVGLAGLNVLDVDSSSFESSAGLWVNDSNTTVTTSATNPKSGSNALQLTAIAAANMVVRAGSGTTGARVKPGDTVSVTESFRAGTTARTVAAGIRYFQIDGVTQVGADAYGTGAADNNAGYTTVTFTGTAPVGAYRAVALGRVTAAALGEVHRMDEAGLNYGSVTTWSSGGFLTTGTISLQSTQRISPVVIRHPARNYMHPQIYSAGALTAGTDGFKPRQANDSVVWHVLDRAPPEAPGDVTTGMIEWVIRVGAFSYLDFGPNLGEVTDGQHPYPFAATPGVSYTGSCWLWASTAHTARLAITFTDEFNTVIGSDTLSTTANLTTIEQKVTVAATAPAGSVYGRLYIEDTSGAADFSMFLTQPRVRRTASPDEVWPGQMFAWVADDVRNARAYPLPTDGAQVQTIYDHEAPPDRPMIYWARINATLSGVSVSSAKSRFVNVYMTPPSYTILKDTSQPENAFQVTYRARGDTATVQEDTTAIHAAGRDADPMFGRDWISGDKGAFQVHIQSELELYRIEQILPSDRTVLLQWKVGGQTYAHITGYSIQRLREPDGTLCLDTYAIITFAYEEQQRPRP